MNLKQAIVATLVYFDIFNYPLTMDEIARWLLSSDSFAKNRLLKLTEKLVRKGVLAQERGIYFLPGRGEIILRRRKNQKISEPKFKIAQKVARILIKVPGVLLVGLTGNLAMMDAQEDDDIDFLIITRRGKIWTARFLTILLLEILGRRRRPKSKRVKDKICLNLFLDEAHLRLGRKRRDLYTAHEILQMKPLAEKESIYQQFVEANAWVKDFLPNAFREKMGVHRQGLEIFPQKRRSKGILVEKILAFLQLWYMRRRQTMEQVKNGQLFFHPQDRRRMIMKQYRGKMMAKD